MTSQQNIRFRDVKRKKNEKAFNVYIKLHRKMNRNHDSKMSSGNSHLNQRHSSCRRSQELFLLLRTGIFLLCVSSFPICSSQQNKAMLYLSQYGYLPATLSNPSSDKIITEDSFSKAIADFQSFSGLNVTGELDKETIRLMETPRCGVKDKVGFGVSSRSKRYALQGSRWKVKDLTYKIAKYPRYLKKDQVDKEVQKAFNVWTEYTDLTFSPKKQGSVHIEIRFEKGEHGDGDPFDGPGGTLAHAYFPVYGGDAHFDDDEHWTIDSYRGTNLFQVAAHEFGHSLGLSHSDMQSALMAPYYRGYQPFFELDEDDISGIQALYGPKSSGSSTSGSTNSRRKTTTTETSNAIDDDPELCNSKSIDTMFKDHNDNTFVFKGDRYWLLTNTGIAKDYPKLISKTWPGLPANIDAAFTYRNGKTYFFKGSQYWRYNGNRLNGSYPKPISEGFAGIPNNVDAAFLWSGNGKIYFFKGSEFWKFDPSAKPPVNKKYPQPISNWEGLPNNVDAALQYKNGYTYFFKKGAYWRFNDRNFQVDSGDPAFPRSMQHWWYGCKSAIKGTLGNLSENSNLSDGVSSASRHQDETDDRVDDLILDAGVSKDDYPDHGHR